MRNAILLFGASASFIAVAALFSPVVAEDRGKGSKSGPSISEIVVTNERTCRHRRFTTSRHRSFTGSCEYYEARGFDQFRSHAGEDKVRFWYYRR